MHKTTTAAPPTPADARPAIRPIPLDIIYTQPTLAILPIRDDVRKALADYIRAHAHPREMNLFADLLRAELLPCAALAAGVIAANTSDIDTAATANAAAEMIVKAARKESANAPQTDARTAQLNLAFCLNQALKTSRRLQRLLTLESIGCAAQNYDAEARRLDKASYELLPIMTLHRNELTAILAGK